MDIGKVIEIGNREPFPQWVPNPDRVREMPIEKEKENAPTRREKEKVPA